MLTSASTTTERCPPGRVLMVQGTASHAGKSTLVAALCRLFADAGFRVAPFKAQNMSLNAAVTPRGEEIARAQMLQARAARIPADARMNPVLLKPVDGERSQVVLLGRVHETCSAAAYYAEREAVWPVITGALDSLRAEMDLVVIEGAGSPAEVNLREVDVANTRVARYAAAPVILVGDIERGGVFASLVGTLALLEPDERELVRGLVVNKFRGDPRLFATGPALLERYTGVPVLGVLPYLEHRLPEEDTLGLPASRLLASSGLPAAGRPALPLDSAASPRLRTTQHGPEDDVGRGPDGAAIDIAVIRLPHLANFDDFDPLSHESGVTLRFVAGVRELGLPHLVIVPGTKATVADLAWLRSRRLDRAIVALRHAGVPVIGICGGYQMLGEWIFDPEGVESSEPVTRGLGLLPTTTTFLATKSTHEVRAQVCATAGLLARCRSEVVTGYEIHMGHTTGAEQPVARIAMRSGRPCGEPDGAIDSEGLTCGTYLHGLFHNDGLRRGVLEYLAETNDMRIIPTPAVDLDAELDRLAAHVAAHLDWRAIRRMVGLAG